MERNIDHFYFVRGFFQTVLPHTLVACHLNRGGTPLHDAVGLNCEKGATGDVKAQMPSIWAKGCMFDNHASVI